MSAGRQAGSPHVRSSLACTTEKYGEKGGRMNNLKPRSASPHHLAWPPGGGHTRAVREPRRLGIRLASLLTERAGRGGAEEEEEERRFCPGGREGGVGGVGWGRSGGGKAGGHLHTEVSILVVVAPRRARARPERRSGGRGRRAGAGLAVPGWWWNGFSVKQRENEARGAGAGDRKSDV